MFGCQETEGIKVRRKFKYCYLRFCYFDSPPIWKNCTIVTEINYLKPKHSKAQLLLCFENPI